MQFDFDKAFHPNEDWKSENVSDQCPCGTCEEAKYFRNNPYYQSEMCDSCKKSALWRVKAIQKLQWFESGFCLNDMSTETLVKELVARGAMDVVISLPLYHTADVHFEGPLTVLQLHGDWSDKF